MTFTALRACAIVVLLLSLTACASPGGGGRGSGATSGNDGKHTDALVPSGDLLELDDKTAAFALSVDSERTINHLVFREFEGMGELALVDLEPGVKQFVLRVPAGRYCISRLKMNSVATQFDEESGCFEAEAKKVTYFGRLQFTAELGVGLERNAFLREDFVALQGRHPDFPAL